MLEIVFCRSTGILLHFPPPPSVSPSIAASEACDSASSRASVSTSEHPTVETLISQLHQGGVGTRRGDIGWRRSFFTLTDVPEDGCRFHSPQASCASMLTLPGGADPESDLRWFPDIPADSDHMTTDHMISPVTQVSLCDNNGMEG